MRDKSTSPFQTGVAWLAVLLFASRSSVGEECTSRITAKRPVACSSDLGMIWSNVRNYSCLDAWTIWFYFLSYLPRKYKRIVGMKWARILSWIRERAFDGPELSMGWDEVWILVPLSDLFLTCLIPPFSVINSKFIWKLEGNPSTTSLFVFASLPISVRF